jgi:hypothetical protein
VPAYAVADDARQTKADIAVAGFVKAIEFSIGVMCGVNRAY